MMTEKYQRFCQYLPLVWGMNTLVPADLLISDPDCSVFAPLCGAGQSRGSHPWLIARSGFWQ